MPLILYPLTTEKSVGGIEKENKLTFVVDKKADKTGIKKEFEETFGEKVKSVRIIISTTGIKKAIISMSRKGAASDIAARLKII